MTMVIKEEKLDGFLGLSSATEHPELFYDLSQEKASSEVTPCYLQRAKDGELWRIMKIETWILWYLLACKGNLLQQKYSRTSIVQVMLIYRDMCYTCISVVLSSE